MGGRKGLLVRVLVGQAGRARLPYTLGPPARSPCCLCHLTVSACPSTPPAHPGSTRVLVVST